MSDFRVGRRSSSGVCVCAWGGGSMALARALVRRVWSSRVIIAPRGLLALAGGVVVV